MERQKLTFNSDSQIVTKLVLSFVTTLYIVMILIYPNGTSYLGRTIGNYLAPIANSIGVNTTWNFFSPDPANTMYFAYNIYFEDEQGNEVKEPLSGYLPSEKNQIVTDASRRRMLYAMRFLMLDDNRLNVLMAPWLCKENPGASRVRIHSVVEKLPNLDEVVLRSDTSVESLKHEVDSRSVSFDCRKPRDEMSL